MHHTKTRYLLAGLGLAGLPIAAVVLYESIGAEQGIVELYPARALIERGPAPVSVGQRTDGGGLAADDGDQEAHGFWTPGPSVALYMDDHYRVLAGAPDEHTVVLEFRERGPLEESFSTWSLTESVSFDLRAIDARGSDELLVAGIARNGDAVIERWTLPQVTGAYATAWPRLQAGSGAVTISPMSSAGVTGGSGYIPPAQRVLPSSMSREEVYRGSLISGVDAIESDPLGRYAVVADWQAAVLFQLQISDPPTVSFLADSSSGLPIADATAIEIRRHKDVQEGIKLMVYYGGHSSSPLITHISDYDNDGVMDLAQSFSATEWSLAGFPADYEEDYRNYGSIGFPHSD